MSIGNEITRRNFTVIPLMVATSAIFPASISQGATAKGSDRKSKTPNRLAIVLDILERGYVKGDLSVGDKWMAQKHIEHEYLALTDKTGPKILEDAIIQTRKSIRNFTLEIQDYADSGDKLWTRSVCRGFETKSGKSFTMDIIDIFRFDGDKIVEHWGVPDRFALFHQLGLIPG